MRRKAGFSPAFLWRCVLIKGPLTKPGWFMKGPVKPAPFLWCGMLFKVPLTKLRRLDRVGLGFGAIVIQRAAKS